MIAAAIAEKQAAGDAVIIPMGHACPTAGLLRQLGLRRLAAPLDWCKSTLQLWAHALPDDLQQLESDSLVRRAADRAHHAVYNEDYFTKCDLWEHGFDAAAVRRRCARLRTLLQSEGREKLGFHLAHELPATATHAHNSQSLQEVVTAATELGRTMARLDSVRHFRLLALVVCLRGSASDRLTHVVAPGELLLRPLDARTDPFGCFARVDPLPNVTVLRYTVPHEKRNKEGAPLPDIVFFPEDAARVRSMLEALYPQFCHRAEQPEGAADDSYSDNLRSSPLSRAQLDGLERATMMGAGLIPRQRCCRCRQAMAAAGPTCAHCGASYCCAECQLADVEDGHARERCSRAAVCDRAVVPTAEHASETPLEALLRSSQLGARAGEARAWCDARGVDSVERLREDVAALVAALKLPQGGKLRLLNNLRKHEAAVGQHLVL